MTCSGAYATRYMSLSIPHATVITVMFRPPCSLSTASFGIQSDLNRQEELKNALAILQAPEINRSRQAGQKAAFFEQE